MATAIFIIFMTAIIALACDAKATDAHSLRVRRLYRRIKKVHKANEQTRLDAQYYTQQVGK